MPESFYKNHILLNKPVWERLKELLAELKESLGSESTKIPLLKYYTDEEELEKRIDKLNDMLGKGKDTKEIADKVQQAKETVGGWLNISSFQILTVSYRNRYRICLYT